MVNSQVFKGDEFESEVKTNSGPRVCPLLVEGPHFACVEHAQCPLLAHRVSVRTPLYVTSAPRADLHFCTHFTGKGELSIFKWSALSMRSADWNV